MSNQIEVEVCYAYADRQYLCKLMVPANSNLQTIIERSGILTLCPEIDLTQQKIGIFSKPRRLTDYAQTGDRIEIYRPLIIDPKEARRKKAGKQPSLVNLR
ncbi:MAG TPA: RnfH family protein [Gammaproteobacteria bacterium]|nr:RnfH family protein [Gammaproteobacteria bacterium]